MAAKNERSQGRTTFFINGDSEEKLVHDRVVKLKESKDKRHAFGEKNRICEGCQNLNLDSTGQRIHVALYDQMEFLRDAGCSGCAVILDAMNLFHERWSHVKPSEIVLFWKVPSILDEVSLLIKLSRARPLDLFQDVKYYIQNIGIFEISSRQGHSVIWPAVREIPSHRAIAGSTNSDESFARLHSWVNECVNNHILCTPTVRELPKRVIDVGTFVGDTKNIRLYESICESDRYTALSHCWGSPFFQPPMTLFDNFLERKFHIPWEELSKTFQNAILITQNLGVRYLWIDSLCIIQDSEEDWQDNCGKMNQIYSGAWLTIAATGAQSGEDGVFLDESPYKDLYQGLKVRKVYFHHILYGLPPLGTEGDKIDPLFRRGWCVQERFLSSRIIHYTKNEMVWECRSNACCECKDTRQALQQGNDQLLGTKSKFHSRNHWQEIVEIYSETELTRYTDNLVAISGVASTIQAWSPGVYLAGIWSGNLEDDLLWCSPDHAKSTPTYTAPSFSWASRLGRVFFLRSLYDMKVKRRRSDIEFVGGSCTRHSDDPFGAVTGGYIDLRGSLFPVTLKVSKLRRLSQIDVALDFSRYQITSESMKDQRAKLHGYRALGFPSHLDTDDYSIDSEPAAAKFFAMPVISIFSESACNISEKLDDELGMFELVNCLILVTNDDGTFRRVGIACFLDMINWEGLVSTTEIRIV